MLSRVLPSSTICLLQGEGKPASILAINNGADDAMGVSCRAAVVLHRASASKHETPEDVLVEELFDPGFALLGGHFSVAVTVRPTRGDQHDSGPIFLAAKRAKYDQILQRGSGHASFVDCMEVDDSREFCLGAVRGCQPNGDNFEDIGIRALAFNIGVVKTRCVDKPYT